MIGVEQPPALGKRGETAVATAHLQAFLDAPPTGGEADRWVRHARQTLDDLRAPPAEPSNEMPYPEA